MEDAQTSTFFHVFFILLHTCLDYKPQIRNTERAGHVHDRPFPMMKVLWH